MLKRIAVIGLMAIALVSAKTYTFSLTDRTEAGQAQLKPGEYSLKVDGSDIVLMDKYGHRYDVLAKVEAADEKFPRTSVYISTVDGTNRILSIQLGGSSAKVVFR